MASKIKNLYSKVRARVSIWWVMRNSFPQLKGASLDAAGSLCGLSRNWFELDYFYRKRIVKELQSYNSIEAFMGRYNV